MSEIDIDVRRFAKLLRKAGRTFTDFRRDGTCRSTKEWALVVLAA
ncbi:hypothetical protein QEV59_10620 [Trueperella pyogenes]